MRRPQVVSSVEDVVAIAQLVLSLPAGGSQHPVDLAPCPRHRDRTAVRVLEARTSPIKVEAGPRGATQRQADSQSTRAMDRPRTYRVCGGPGQDTASVSLRDPNVCASQISLGNLLGISPFCSMAVEWDGFSPCRYVDPSRVEVTGPNCTTRLALRDAWWWHAASARWRRLCAGLNG